MPDARLLESGKRLVAALDAEHRRSKLYPKDIAQVVAYLEEVSFLRQRVDQCAQEYCALLAECGFSNVDVKDVVERGEHFGASGLATLAR